MLAIAVLLPDAAAGMVDLAVLVEELVQELVEILCFLLEQDNVPYQKLLVSYLSA